MKNKKIKCCKICGNIIVKPGNKTNICPRCTENGVKGVGIAALGIPVVIKGGKKFYKIIKDIIYLIKNK